MDRHVRGSGRQLLPAREPDVAGPEHYQELTWALSARAIHRRTYRDAVRTSITIEDLDGSGVEVRTEAQLICEDAVGTAIRIGGRYIGQERADSYVRSFSDDQLKVRLVPLPGFR